MTVNRTDNANLVSKLALRRYFLRKYHDEKPPHVMDCCQGTGVIWSRLRLEFELVSYWGIDEKPRKGRLKIDSARILSQPGWPQDVIDIDTYGSPWKHWRSLLPNLSRPTTVFLTIGVGGNGIRRKIGSDSLEALQLGTLTTKIPHGIEVRLGVFAVSYCLAMGCDYATMMEVAESPPGRNARYIGVRLEPLKSGDPQVRTASRPEHTRSEKETEHV